MGKQWGRGPAPMPDEPRAETDMPKSPGIHVRAWLTEWLLSKLDAWAKGQGRTRSSQIKRYVVEGLKRDGVI